MKSKLFLHLIFFSVTTLLALGCQNGEKRAEEHPFAETDDVTDMGPPVDINIEAPGPEFEALRETVKGHPSYSQLQAVIAAKDKKEIQRCLDAATRLKEGLMFPLDTFAVNKEKTLLIANDKEGTGILRSTGGVRRKSRGDIQETGILYLGSGPGRTIYHYQPELYRISGQAADTTAMQEPIEGVTVLIVAADGTEFGTTTDVNGEFEYAGISAGHYLIRPYKDGYRDHPGRSIRLENHGFVSLRMTKKFTIVDFLQSRVPMYWVLILCVIIVSLFFVMMRPKSPNLSSEGDVS